MKIITKLLDALRLEKEDTIRPYSKVPKYITDMNWEQDSNQSIVDSCGKYDFTNFSEHEINTIKHVLAVTQKKYPEEYQSLGLANESYPIKYKPRYILHEIIILKYENSLEAIDKFAVALAYSTKGAYYREKALEYFEASIDNVSPEIMSDFVSYMPLHTYSIISSLYEQVRDFQEAIYYTKLQKEYGDPDNSYFDERINKLLDKEKLNPAKRALKMSQKRMELEYSITKAAREFLQTGRLPSKKESIKIKRPRQMSKDEIERYAVMCNAYMEHQDEMELYENRVDRSPE